MMEDYDDWTDEELIRFATDNKLLRTFDYNELIALTRELGYRLLEWNDGTS